MVIQDTTDMHVRFETRRASGFSLLQSLLALHVIAIFPFLLGVSSISPMLLPAYAALASLFMTLANLGARPRKRVTPECLLVSFALNGMIILCLSSLFFIPAFLSG